jgi:hypothetical protein
VFEEVEVHGLEVVDAELLHPQRRYHGLSGIAVECLLALHSWSLVVLREVEPRRVLSVNALFFLLRLHLDVGSELIHVALL